jgi:hypothetical protein
VLPLAKRYNVAAINRGLVQGKSQTHLPWDSWRRPYTDREPDVWFHEVFRTNGTPYRAEETEMIKRLTGRGKAAAVAAGAREACECRPAQRFVIPNNSAEYSLGRFA